MMFRSPWHWLVFLIGLTICAVGMQAQAPAQSSSSSSSSSSSAKRAKKSASDANVDPGAVADGVYRNRALALSCKVPSGWVLRTDEMNQPDEKSVEEKAGEEKTSLANAASSAGAKVLLAAFSRPPEARAEDVNASILIAAESVEAYPGLQDAEQYFGPLTEVAKAQGFIVDEEPYETAIGTKKIMRGDFHKDVGSRVMHQSTLALLAHGYAISITLIGGTDDEVEELIDGLTFTPSGK